LELYLNNKKITLQNAAKIFTLQDFKKSSLHQTIDCPVKGQGTHKTDAIVSLKLKVFLHDYLVHHSRQTFGIPEAGEGTEEGTNPGSFTSPH